MKSKLIRKVAPIAILIAVLASALSAYVLLNPKRTWSQTPTYIVDERGLASVTDSEGDRGVSATVNAIEGASAWNGAGAGNVVNAQAGSVAGWTLGDGVPMLNFADPENVCVGSCLAATFTGFYETTGRGRNRTTRIVDADIVTNAAYNWTSTLEDPQPNTCSNEFYIEGVQVHEIGHALGLGHSNTGGATMFPSVAACDNGPATISSDDVFGILDLYGTGGGGGGGGGGGCTLGQKNDQCSADSQCCSGMCKKNGRCR